MTTTQSAKTTIYYTPYVSNLVPIYNGTSFAMTAFSELSVLTTDATKSPAAIGVNKVNDWFVWNDAGTIRIGHGPDWTSDTVRSAGTALVMVNGILLNDAAITNGPAAQRGTYVGTTRSNASSQLDWIYGAVAGAGGTPGVFGVWNMFHRRLVASFVGTTVDSWTYSSTTVRAANGSNNTRHSFVSGLAEDAFEGEYSTMITANGEVGIGFNATNAYSGRQVTTGNVEIVQGIGKFATATLGFNFFQACESVGAASATFAGDFGIPTRNQCGLHFKGWM
jgi:hypothetical protein